MVSTFSSELVGNVVCEKQVDRVFDMNVRLGKTSQLTKHNSREISGTDKYIEEVVCSL